MPQTSAQWAEALAPGIREWFSIGYASRPTLMGELFNVMPSESANEYFHSFGSVAPDAWADYQFTGRVAKVGFDKGYKTTFTHEEFAVELDVQRKFIDDNKYPQVLDAARQLGDSAALKREMDAVGVFNNADAATRVGGDAVAGLGLVDDAEVQLAVGGSDLGLASRGAGDEVALVVGRGRGGDE